MTTGLFRITAVALAAVLSACAASAPPLRVAAVQVPGSQLHGSTARPALDCGYDDGGFGTPDAMKLPKDAFSGCSPQ
jgi:hypothetical protein